MAKLAFLIELLQQIAPSEYALGFDNAGLNVGNADDEITGVTVCLDVSEEVIEEAKNRGDNLIISHHPVIFSPIKNLVCGEKTNDVIIKAVQNSINLYSMHTNLDAVSDGINDALAQLLGMRDSCVIDEVTDGVGIGRVGTIDEISVRGLMQRLNAALSCYSVTSSDSVEKKITSVAVVNGAGADEEYIKRAQQMGAQVFVSGEFKHHVALYARAIGMPLISVSHYASEGFYLPTLTKRIAEKLEANGVKIKVTTTLTGKELFDCVVG